MNRTQWVAALAVAGLLTIRPSEQGQAQAIPVLRNIPAVNFPATKPAPTIDKERLRVGEVAVSETKLDSAIMALNTTKDRPTNLKDLTGGYRLFQYQLNLDAAIKLNLIAAGAKLDGAEKVFVHDFIFYKDGEDEHGQPIRWGSGVRLIIQARNLGGSANFSSLPAIAASAEFRFAETTVDLRTIGISGPKIVAAVPKAAAYDVATHVAYMKAVDAIVAAATDPVTVVTPEVVTVNPQDSDNSVDAIVRAYAMREILLGKSCEDARKGLQRGHIPRAEQALIAAYRELAGRCDRRAPSDRVRHAILLDLFKHAGVAP